MQFWLGTHMTNWLEQEPNLFVSRRRLNMRKKMPRACGSWALDSGGFTELNLFGRWETTVDEYIADVFKYQREIGELAWAAPMDWMCEPFVLAKTGLSVVEHQARTVENFLRLRERLGELVIPVLQGWTIHDYHRCWELYEKVGIELAGEPLVGLGSICRRQDMEEAETIVRSLSGLRLHGFGIKATGLEAYADALSSADSMAWSYAARKRSTLDIQETLFEWPRWMLCGLLHPTDHKARTCANCLPWARLWRNQEVAA